MMSIKRILCPIDLSPDSDAALRYATALATAYEAKLFAPGALPGPHCAPAQARGCRAHQCAVIKKMKEAHHENIARRRWF